MCVWGSARLPPERSREQFVSAPQNHSASYSKPAHSLRGFFHALRADGLPAVCIEARHVQKILSETLNKTDANDADGLAQLAETGFYKAVRVKSFDAMLIRTLVGARTQLLTITTQIRGVPKTFGLIVPKGIGRVFDFNVRELPKSKCGGWKVW